MRRYKPAIGALTFWVYGIVCLALAVNSWPAQWLGTVYYGVLGAVSVALALLLTVGIAKGWI